MQIIHDSYIVLVDKKYNTEETKSGIIPLSKAYMEDWAEEHLKHRRLYGTVMVVPRGFSDTVVDVILPGLPEPRLFVSGEYIERAMQLGNRRLPEYNPSSFDKFPEVTMADIASKVNVGTGQKIYFDYLATDPENFLGPYNEGELYKINVDQIYFAVREDKVEVQGGWCAVTPKMETWEDITTPSGIIKRPSPQAIYLEGIVKYISEREDVKVGDKIIYQRNADYAMNIEGENCYVMRESDILCKL